MKSSVPKSPEYVIGLDCSTTAIKAVVFDSEGNQIAFASENISLSTPQLNYYEQDPDEWWHTALVVLKRITAKVNPDFIKALSISNQRETFVALDNKQKPLRSAIIWLDERCKSEVESFSKLVGKNKIHKITGKPPDFAPVVYRLAWMKKYEPKLYSKISMICDVQSWLVWKLTDNFKTSYASADPFGLLDLKTKTWSKQILRKLNLTENQFSQVLPPGTILGKIKKERSILTGLSYNTLVIAGGGDGQAAGLGSNILTSRTAYLNLGTAVVAGIYGKECLIDKAFRTMTALSEKGYYYECSLRAGTFTLDWFVKKILKIDTDKEKDIYKTLETEAEQIPIGSEGLFFLPYLSGVMNPYWDKEARGSFIGLSSSHKRAHLYKAILEGIAYEQLFVLNSVEDSVGIRIRELVAIGGGAKSRIWCQIIADITGKKVLIPNTSEASALGAAISAAVGAGIYLNFKGAAKNMTSVKSIVKPIPSNNKHYKKLFSLYTRIYPAIKHIIKE